MPCWSTVDDYKNRFIEFMVRSGVLTFGDFVTKSGRASPYFVNTGRYSTGAQMRRLGEFYGCRWHRNRHTGSGWGDGSSDGESSGFLSDINQQRWIEWHLWF